jgi:ABC-type nitrate/sulfonate/bicarbonate transport system permease component
MGSHPWPPPNDFRGSLDSQPLGEAAATPTGGRGWPRTVPQVLEATPKIIWLPFCIFLFFFLKKTIIFYLYFYYILYFFYCNGHVSASY